MTQYTNNAEGATGHDVAITTVNSGGLSGDAFTTVSSGSGGTTRWTNTDVYRGAYSIAVAQPNAANSSIVDLQDSVASAAFAIRFYLKFDALPTVTNQQFPVAVRTTGGAAGRVEMSNTGQVRCSATGTSAYSVGTLAINTWYRIEFYGSGFGTASTVCTVKAYLGDSLTEAASSVMSAATTAAPVQVARFGKIAAGNVINYKMDDLAVNFGSATPLGISPTGYAGDDISGIEPYSIVPLTGSYTGTWSQTSGTTVSILGSGNNVSFKAPGSIAGEVLGFSFGGDPMTVTTLPVTERAVRGGVEVPLEIQQVKS